jgi:LPXTG-site transpeptidase (sortase) family protein
LWIEIPSLGVKASITGVPPSAQGWDLTWLYSQVGWLEGTAYPTWNGNTVLTAHAYTSDGLPGPFVLLKNLEYGDTFIIHANSQKYVYSVRSRSLVKASNITLLTKHEELDWVTLITCQQYDEKSKTYLYRWVVRAVLTSIQSDNTTKK